MLFKADPEIEIQFVQATRESVDIITHFSFGLITLLFVYLTIL